MISIKEYENRFPKLNEDFFNSLSEEEKENHLKRIETYHNALINMLIKTLDLTKLEEDFSKSKNAFRPISEEEQDLYQQMSSDKLKYLYLRNNIYVERLSEEELKILDNNKNEEVYPLVQETFKTVINDYPDKQMITNYGPDANDFYTQSSNIIFGIRVDDTFFPEGVNKVELIMNREFELDFLKHYLETKIKDNCQIDGTVIKYTKNSVKTLSNEEETTNSITK